jgi:hypothetical protein
MVPQSARAPRDIGETSIQGVLTKALLTKKNQIIHEKTTLKFDAPQKYPLLQCITNHQLKISTFQPVRSAYQPPASSTFLSERTSHK